MSAAAAPEFVGIIAQLPPGSSLRMDNVSWDDYEELLADLGESYSVRVFYDQGRMEIMSPLPEHERPKRLVGRMIESLSFELNMPMASFGSTTFRQKSKGRDL